MPSPQWSFSLFPCCAPRFCGAVGRRKRQPFPLPKRATCASGGSMDGRRFGRAPKSAAFSRGARLKMTGSMSEAAFGTFVVRVAQEAGRLAAHSLCELSMVFHPPKVAKRKLTPRGGVAARSPPALFRKRAFEDRKRAPHDRKRGNAASSKVPAGVFERRPCLFSRHFWRARKEKAAKAPFFCIATHVTRPVCHCVGAHDSSTLSREACSSAPRQTFIVRAVDDFVREPDIANGALRVQFHAHGLSAPVHAGDGAVQLAEHAVDDLDAIAPPAGPASRPRGRGAATASRRTRGRAR